MNKIGIINFELRKQANQRLLKKYGKEDIIIDLENIGFRNIKFRKSRKEGIDGYNIYGDVIYNIDTYFYNSKDNYIDYWIVHTKDKKIELSRYIKGIFTKKIHNHNKILKIWEPKKFIKKEY